MKYKLCVAVVDNDSKVKIPATGIILGCEMIPPSCTAKPGEIQKYRTIIRYLMEDEG